MCYAHDWSFLHNNNKIIINMHRYFVPGFLKNTGFWNTYYGHTLLHEEESKEENDHNP